ncbi:MAG: SulP family inorganic anion transporter [Gammaproteobacteria bacterium]|nr:SulP family inorganic anion transporter [Gammaproteobacteria bacterium]
MNVALQKNQLTTRLLPFLAWLPLLDRATFRIDLLAGITAGILIVPQAIALAVLAGMPPEYGLYTSIFPVVVAALFGSSWQAMSGPNTALCILISFSIAPYASPQTPDWVQYAITLTFLAALIQLAFGVLRLGVVFNYFSHTVMVALVTGVGIIIVLQQAGNLTGLLMSAGLPIEDAFRQVLFNLHSTNPYALTVGVATILSGLMVKKFRSKWPHLLIAVLVGTLLAWLLDTLFGSARAQIDKLGTISLSALPFSAPDFSVQHFSEAKEGLFSAAFLVAFLGLMQSAVIARAMAVRSGQAVNMNQEVIGQGLSNLAGSFLSCFPSCGSFNRSASNIESGARTPLAAIISAAFLAGLVFFAAPLVRELPIAVMAGVLILVGMGLVKPGDIKHILSVRGESRIVFLLTLGTTLFSGLNNGVFLGIAVSIIAYLRATSKPEIEILVGDGAKQYLPAESPEGVVVQISGSLFFGSLPAVELAINDLGNQDQRRGTLVISGEHIEHLDGTSAEYLTREALRRRKNGGHMSLWLRSHNLDAVIATSGLRAALGAENIFYTQAG